MKVQLNVVFKRFMNSGEQINFDKFKILACVQYRFW